MVPVFSFDLQFYYILLKETTKVDLIVKAVEHWPVPFCSGNCRRRLAGGFRKEILVLNVRVPPLTCTLKKINLKFVEAVPVVTKI